MDGLLHVSATGASEIFKKQAVHHNNLANGQTAGFKADVAELFSMPVYGDGVPSRVFAGSNRPGSDLGQGQLDSTGNNLDVALGKETWLSVQTDNSAEGYSKRGDLMLDSQNFLINGAGHKLIGEGGPIVIPPYQSLTIGSSGNVDIVPLGDKTNTPVNIAKLKLVAPEASNLYKTLDGVFATKDNSVAPIDENPQIKSGALETSNVNGVSELLGLINVARQFEMNIKMMKVAEENDQAAARFMHIN